MQELTYLYNEDMPMLLGMIAAILIVVIAAILFARYLYRTSDSRKIKRIIRKYSDAYVREVAFSNGIGGFFFIDYLILLRAEPSKSRGQCFRRGEYRVMDAG